MNIRRLIKVGPQRLRGLVRGHRGVRIGARVRLGGPGTYDLRPGSAVRPGARVWVGSGATLTLMPGSAIGDRSIVNVETSVTVGEGSQISWDAQILDTDFHRITAEDGSVRPHTASILIGRGVLIGTGAMVLKGVELGDGVVVAAGSVVTKSVGAGTVVGGNPAVPIGRAAGWV